MSRWMDRRMNGRMVDFRMDGWMTVTFRSERSAAFPCKRGWENKTE